MALPLSDSELTTSTAALRDALREANRGLVGRDWLLELICLAALASEHVLVVGPPGTAKSEAVRRVALALGGSYFEYLLGRFTEPSELLGPIDLRKLREGTVETLTAGMLPEAEFAFLDELFLGSTAILNTLLGILNERVFRRGHTVHTCTLRVCVAATNALPADEMLAALADRFMLRAYVHPVADAMLEELLEAGFAAGRAGERRTSLLPELDRLAAAVQSVEMSSVRPTLAEALRTLRNAGVTISDRRAVRCQRLVAAAALLAGRRTAGAQDVWPLLYVVPTEAEQLSARELLGDLLSRSTSPVLPSAAERATFSRAALAERLARDADELLAARASLSDDEEKRRLRLRIEALGREIDAGFSAADMGESLKHARARLVEALA